MGLIPPLQVETNYIYMNSSLKYIYIEVIVMGSTETAGKAK